MEIVDIMPETQKSLTLPWDEVTLMPIGDVQVGSQGVERDRLRRHLAWGVERGAYFLGMGDYVDVMSPSNREAWRKMRRYESVTEALQEKAAEHVEDFLSLIAGTEGRWLGILHGHHYFDFEDGTTSDTRIAQRLKAPFLGTCGAIVLKFRQGKHGMRCVVWAHHGWGSSRRQSGPINSLEDVSGWFDADVYLMGHQTKKPAVPKSKLYVSERPPHRLLSKKVILAGTGGFHQGYVQGGRANGLARGGYVEQYGLPPVSLGGVVVRIRPVWGGDDRLDLNCEV